MKRISGTKEWSTESVNCVLGCPHRCRYCYAAARAVRFRQCTSREDWGTNYHRLRKVELKKRRSLVDGRVMFPTTHDITPQFLPECMEVIRKLLVVGNDLLIVSKPHIDCITAICREFRMFRDSILFRFSIGAMNDSILSYWEPGAPTFSERLACLHYARSQGYATSVSCEPLLEAERARQLFDTLVPYITDTIWFGKLNHIRQRVAPGTSDAEIARIENGQTDAAIKQIYLLLKEEPKARWKESYKAVLGLDLAETAGLDI